MTGLCEPRGPCQPRRGASKARHVAHHRPHLPDRRAPADRFGDRGAADGRARRAGRAQRRRQDDAVPVDPRRDRAGGRLDLDPETLAHRQRRAGSARRIADAHRLRARGRRRAQRADGRGRGGERSDADRRNPDAAGGHRRARGAGARGAHSLRSRLRRGGAEPDALGILRRLAHASRARRGAVLRAGSAAARRAHQLPRSRGGAVAGRLSEDLSGDDPRHLPRSRPARRRRQPYPASGQGQAHALDRRLFQLRAPARRTDGRCKARR